MVLTVTDNGTGRRRPCGRPGCVAWPTGWRLLAALLTVRTATGSGTDCRGQPPAAEEVRLTPLRVAIADDSMIVREGLARLLVEAGHEV